MPQLTIQPTHLEFRNNPNEQVDEGEGEGEGNETILVLVSNF